MTVIKNIAHLVASTVCLLSFAVAPNVAQAKESLILLPQPSRTWSSPGHTTYYVDPASGNDSNDGKSERTAFRSPVPINSGVFSAGDRVLFHAGSRFAGFLAPGGSGLNGDPIVIGMYGKGHKPEFNAQGKWLTTVLLYNDSFITCRDLDISNTSQEPVPHLNGIKVSEIEYGDSAQIALENLDIHDVNGSDVKDDGGGAGIECSTYGVKVPTRFNGLQIRNCHIRHTDRNGIVMDGSWSRSQWHPSIHVIIEHNLLEDIGGDGIVPIACDGAVIQYNILRGGRMRASDYAAGIWPWSCDNTVIQFNDVSGMKGTNDGEGYDSDYNCQNTLIQYNFSHNNDGGFLLVCDNGGQHLPDNIGNIGTVVRYNVSINDGCHVFHFGGPCTNTSIYNNTIYIGIKAAPNLVVSDSWNGLQSGSVFTNNLFITNRAASFVAAGQQFFTMVNNALWGSFSNLPPDSSSLRVRSGVLKVGGSQPLDYRPSKDSLLIGAGVPLPHNGARDYIGTPVTSTSAPTIGAFER